MHHHKGAMLNIDGALGADQSDIQDIIIAEKPRLYVTLQKSDKQICRTKPVGHHFIRQTSIWQITKFHSIGVYKESNFPQFQLFPQPENQYQSDEWPVSMGFLHKYEKVALVSLEGYELYIQAPDAEFSHAIVMYQILSQPSHNSMVHNLPACGKEVIGPQEVTGNKAAFFIREVDASPPLSFGEATNNLRGQSLKKNFLRNHPTILKALSHTHGWIFGAIAELVDNSMDANSKRLDINIESFYLKKEGKTIPVLSVIDDGHGMSHDKIMTMIAFGHSLPEGRLSGSIGRFGIGFKTGSMRLGKDAIVLTQTSTSRSVALLSQTFNEDKPNLEVPVVSYCKHNNYMELDLSIQSEASAEYTLKGSDQYKPDHSVQCDKCGTWRALDSAFNSDTSLGRRREDPHRQVAHGVITVSAKGSGYGEDNTTTEDPVSSRAGPSKRKKVKAAQRLSPQSSSSATAETDAGILNISTGEEDSGGNNDNIEEKIRASTLASLRRLRLRGRK